MKILIAHENHCVRYFDASTPEALAAASLTLLTERRGVGYHKPEVPEETYELPAPEVLEALPEDVRSDLEKRAARSRRQSEAEREYARWWASMNKVVESKSLEMITLGRGRFERQVPLAYQLLCERSDYEYERIEIVEVEDVSAILKGTVA